MDLPFTHKPGRRERHLRRRHENPLFAWPPREVAPEDLLAAQKADHEEMESFRGSFQDLVRRAVELPPNAGSDEVLSLKEELERHYEQSWGLPEDHAAEREAIVKLIGMIMKAVRRSAGDEPLARQELRDEEEARAIHFRLLQQPLVADLLHPDSPISPDELAPSVLSASEPEIDALFEFLDPDQLALLAAQAAELLDSLKSREVELPEARARLAAIRGRLPAEPGPGRVN
jgi:hypothetical protein